jgi:four helix bundle protein
MLDYERLDVYRCSLDLLSEALRVAALVPRGYGPVAEQLRRAALSVPLNIAEGMGRYDTRDRRRCLTIARGSAMECGALFDVFGRLPGADATVTRTAKALVHRVVQMLTRLGARPEEPPPSTPTRP